MLARLALACSRLRRRGAPPQGSSSPPARVVAPVFPVRPTEVNPVEATRRPRLSTPKPTWPNRAGEINLVGDHRLTRRSLALSFSSDHPRPARRLRLRRPHRGGAARAPQAIDEDARRPGVDCTGSLRLRTPTREPTRRPAPGQERRRGRRPHAYAYLTPTAPHNVRWSYGTIPSVPYVARKLKRSKAKNTDGFQKRPRDGNRPAPIRHRSRKLIGATTTR